MNEKDMNDNIQKQKDNTMEDNNLIMEQIKALTTRISDNFSEIFEKFDKVFEKMGTFNTELELLKLQLKEHIASGTNNKLNCEKRFNDIESNPSLKTSDNWKWLLGIIGGIYLVVKLLIELGVLKIS